MSVIVSDETVVVRGSGWQDDEEPDVVGSEQIRSLVADEVVYIEPAASVRAAAEAMRASDVGLLVVGAADEAIGVLSERDVTDAVARGLDLDDAPVSDIEHDDLRWATADAPLEHVAEEMLESHLRHVLVRADDGSLLGVVSMRDVLGALL